MGALTYTAIASLDGFIEDEGGEFDWAKPDEEVHAFVNRLERPVGTHLLGRRMYETLAYWGTEEPLRHQHEVIREFARAWRDAENVVFSRTLERPSTAATRIERRFDAEAVARLKDSTEREISVGGAELAAEAFRAGLVDECRLLLVPVAVGRGKRALPDDLRLDLELLEERRFDGGTVYLRYGVTS